MTPTKLLIGTVFSVLAIAVGGVWFATEWAAWHLGFQPQLGAPWFTLFGYPIYPVWALFVWWYAYDAYAPIIFNQAGGIAALGGVAGWCGHHRIAVARSPIQARHDLWFIPLGDGPRHCRSRSVRRVRCFSGPV